MRRIAVSVEGFLHHGGRRKCVVLGKLNGEGIRRHFKRLILDLFRGFFARPAVGTVIDLEQEGDVRCVVNNAHRNRVGQRCEKSLFLDDIGGKPKRDGARLVPFGIVARRRQRVVDAETFDDGARFRR